jgi:hypothetical protein
MQISSGTWFDHRLEALEPRSLLSAASNAAPASPVVGHAQVVIADADFLNAGSDAADTSPAGSENDADMYDFDSSGRSPATQAMSAVVTQSVGIDDGSVAQDGDRPMWSRTPSDVSTLATPTWGRPAEYNGAEPVITANDAPVMIDVPEIDTPADAPVAGGATAAPVVEAVHAPAPMHQPEAITVASPSGESSFVWLESGVTKAKSTTAAEQVVIVSSYVGG